MISSLTARARNAASALKLGWEASPWSMVGQLLLALATGTAPTATAWLTARLIDVLIRTDHASTDGTDVITLAVALAGLAGATAVLNHLTSLLSAAMASAVNLTVHDRLYTRINAFQSLRPFEDPATQDTVRLAEQSAQGAPRQVLEFLFTSTRSLATIVGFTGAALTLWPPMGALLAATVVVAAAGQLRLAKQSAEATTTMMSNLRRQLSYRMLLTDRRAATEIRLFGIGSLFQQRAMAELRKAGQAELGVQRRNALVQSALAILAAGCAGTATVMVAHQVLAGRITVGQLTLFTAAVAAIQGALTSVLMQLGRTEESLRLFGTFRTLLGTPADLTDGTLAPTPLAEGITFENVWFRYDPDGPWILQGLHLRLPHGKAIGLVGANGAGKSTLVKLLCRFYDPDRGRILWDGVDIRALSVVELRRRIGVTFQDYMSYDMTARDNIGVGAPELMTDLPRIRAAAGHADIDDTLAAMPRGYDTMLSRIFLDDRSQAGVLLSGGQWQRVALARSLLRHDADLLILDEPSAGLDPIAERRVHETLARHREGCTSLLISHRLSALRDADVIVVLADGGVVEQGHHDELLAREGHYARLFGAQAEGYQDTRSLT